MYSRLSFLSSAREWGVACLILVCILGLNVGYRWFVFEQYIQQDRQVLQARILNQYLKNDKWVFKLKAQNGLILYMTSKEKLKNLKNREIQVFGKPAKCSFIQSFKSCFFIALQWDVLPKNWRSIFYDLIQIQHDNTLMAELYQTLFFATTLPRQWRDFASELKIAHLLAISGLHLAILSCVFLFLLTPLYRFFQSRFFPYRNRIFDLGFLLLLVLGGYLILLDFPPSFLRAYAMSVLGFVFLYCHFGILNFVFLCFCACLILVFFPGFLFSLGFWLSVVGVFYIFLFLKYIHFNQIQNLWLRALVSLCVLNIVLFVNMLPLTHLFFPSYSLFSFLAIPLSVVFMPFFVFVLVLHILGMGGMMDQILLLALSLSWDSFVFRTPLWFGILYAVFSVCAIKSRIFYWFVLGLGGLFCIFLIVKAF